jgi:hypothetical protein
LFDVSFKPPANEIVGLIVGQGSYSCEYSLRIAVFMLLFTAASVVQENEDGNTVTGWLEYLVDMKGARRERNATDVIGPAPWVTT